tara:strand:+ start:175 stop:462 length:288 start_codon:yes stop_codon:yes gene_type:complete
MERHDYDLKQREDSLINVTSEEAFCMNFHLNLKFDYKGKQYEATAYYQNDYGIDDIDIWDKDHLTLSDENIYDELYSQVRGYFEDMDISEKTITW